MKKMFVPVLMMIFLVGAAPTSADDHGPRRHYKDSLFAVTQDHLFGLEMVLPGGVLKAGGNAFDMIVHDKDDKDVVGADLVIMPWMPSMGHGVVEKPVVTERGGGIYSVSNVNLIMAGHWELRVQVMKDGLTDAGVFDFPDVSGTAGHDMTGMTVPPALDLSTTRLSAHGLYKVAVASKLNPIVIGRMHNWELRITTPDGKPVTAARVSIDGGMPQHGHGLPTEPAVTKDLGNGDYLVGGMKFSMPGWWIVNFHIESAEGPDTVTFNLVMER